MPDKSSSRAMEKAWMQTANGTSGTEATFRADSNGRRTATSYLPFTIEQSKQTNVDIKRSTYALFHVHPVGREGRPSPNDEEVANSVLSDRAKNRNSNGYLSFTFGATGLYAYDPATNKTTKLRNSYDWLHPCESNGTVGNLFSVGHSDTSGRAGARRSLCARCIPTQWKYLVQSGT